MIVLLYPTRDKGHSRNPSGPCFLTLPASLGLAHAQRVSQDSTEIGMYEEATGDSL